MENTTVQEERNNLTHLADLPQIELFCGCNIRRAFRKKNFECVLYTAYHA